MKKNEAELLKQNNASLWSEQGRQAHEIQELKYDIAHLANKMGLQRHNPNGFIERFEKAPKAYNQNNWRRRFRQWLRGER